MTAKSVADKSKADKNISGVQNTATGISQLSVCSKFNSPALKKKFNKPSIKNEESYISENLPSILISNGSNDHKVMEEIKELQTRENCESNPLENRRLLHQRNVDGHIANRIFTHDTQGYFQKVVDESSYNNSTNRTVNMPNKRPIFGNLLKWTQGPRLGFGVFGDVLKAINCKTGEILAVKRLGIRKNMNEFNKEAIESLKCEINILKQIDHKNIIRYIGSEIIDENFCIYLEYASEGSLLSAYHEFGPFDEDLIKRYTRQIVEGL